MDGLREQLALPDLPDDIVALFEKVITLCKESGVHSVDLKVSSGSLFPSGPVQCQWVRGRHGAKSQTIVRAEIYRHIQV